MNTGLLEDDVRPLSQDPTVPELPDAVPPGPTAASAYPEIPDYLPGGAAWTPYFDSTFSTDDVDPRAPGAQPPPLPPTYPTTVDKPGVPAIDGRQQGLYGSAHYDLRSMNPSAYTSLSMAYGDGNHPHLAASPEFDAQPTDALSFQSLGPPQLTTSHADFNAGNPWLAPELQDKEEGFHRANRRSNALGSGSEETSSKKKGKAPRQSEGANFKRRHKGTQADADGSHMKPASQEDLRRRKSSAKQQPPTFIEIDRGNRSMSNASDNPRPPLITPSLTPSSGQPSTTVPQTPSTSTTAYLPSPSRGAFSSEPLQGKATRARNRVATTKCRAKSKAANQQLEEEARETEEQHRSLTEIRDELKEMVWQLNMQLLDHHDCGDELIEQYIHHSARQRVEKRVREANAMEHLEDMNAEVDEEDEDEDDDDDDKNNENDDENNDEAGHR